MVKDLEWFLSQIPEINGISHGELIDYFVYYLTAIKDKAGAKPKEIEECFVRAHLSPYRGVRQYLHRKVASKKGQRPTFVRTSEGYCLERSRKEELERIFKAEPLKKETSTILRDLLGKVNIGSEREFLEEAISCYEIGANRAAIVMGWILALDHLYEYILGHGLPAFNVGLAKVKDKRVRVNVVSSKDDFSDIPEAKFIEICRSAKIISNDVRKILDTKLGTRNSCAHPSGVKITKIKATEFLDDLVTNVILKYPL